MRSACHSSGQQTLQLSSHHFDRLEVQLHLRQDEHLASLMNARFRKKEQHWKEKMVITLIPLLIHCHVCVGEARGRWRCRRSRVATCQSLSHSRTRTELDESTRLSSARLSFPGRRKSKPPSFLVSQLALSTPFSPLVLRTCVMIIISINIPSGLFAAIFYSWRLCARRRASTARDISRQDLRRDKPR